jgi:anti-sigma regulatory factor (Ser/Thr protein kinase)
MHGNGMDELKKVYISCTVSDKKLEVSVRDEGSGDFPYRVMSLEEVKPDSISGRGIFLVRNFVDELLFNPDTRTVTFRKYISNG